MTTMDCFTLSRDGACTISWRPEDVLTDKLRASIADPPHVTSTRLKSRYPIVVAHDKSPGVDVFLELWEGLFGFGIRVS